MTPKACSSQSCACMYVLRLPWPGCLLGGTKPVTHQVYVFSFAAGMRQNGGLAHADVPWSLFACRVYSEGRHPCPSSGPGLRPFIYSFSNKYNNPLSRSPEAHVLLWVDRDATKTERVPSLSQTLAGTKVDSGHFHCPSDLRTSKKHSLVQFGGKRCIGLIWHCFAVRSSASNMISWSLNWLGSCDYYCADLCQKQSIPIAHLRVYICPDESMGGTHFAQKRAKQRDARPLNNGTRPVSLYKNCGFGRFLEVPISDAGSSAWLAMMPQPSQLAPLVFFMFEFLRNRNSSFSWFVFFFFFELPDWKRYKNRGLGQPASSTIFCLEIAFFECTSAQFRR